MNYICEWREDEDGIWDTGCGNRFEFNHGGPPENSFEFCPYCGKKLKVHRYQGQDSGRGPQEHNE
jgi:rRNA maturation endonuclease Nob1